MGASGPTSPRKTPQPWAPRPSPPLQLETHVHTLLGRRKSALLVRMCTVSSGTGKSALQVRTCTVSSGTGKNALPLRTGTLSSGAGKSALPVQETPGGARAARGYAPKGEGQRNVFFDHNGIQLEIRSRRKIGKFTNK